MLEDLGLDETCTSVYRTLLSQPQAGFNELHSRLGLSEHDLSKSLDRLSELALIREMSSEPLVLQAVNPAIGVESLISQQQAHIAAEQGRLENIRLISMRLAEEFSAARLRELQGIERLNGVEEVRDRIRLLAKGVRSEYLVFAPGGALTEADLAVTRPRDEALLRRNVRMRTLYLDSIRCKPSALAHAHRLADQGAQVRTAPSLPLRLAIADRSTALIPLDNENSEADTLVLTCPGPVIALCALFDALWDQATPLGARPSPAHAAPLSPQESEVLRLLAQGHTDEAVAKRLGVSPRTARRIAADLMDKLDARSRFQAGARAVAHGWLVDQA
ncbi:LuxR C-terminal-related transcriptional regulator [Streptomyces sp. NPDC091279]|uniref:LuxR C-terminal-related transcriptional regulator n=1 Tax=unclassified Streptomyces TaxID=2593676 RepID=UPI00382F5357